MAIQTLTYTEVIGRCHGLPYPDEQQYAQITAQFYHFRLKEVWNADDSGNYVTVGWIVPCTAINMPWTSKFRVDHQSKTIDIPYAEGEDYESRAITEQLIVARSQGLLSLSKKLEEELYRVLGINRTVRVPRGGSALFGIQTFGIQMTGYVLSEKTGEMKIWVPKRSATRMQWPGMMDNTVGGGANFDEEHFDCMVREAEEEASLPREFMRENAKVVGTISYFHVRDAKAPGGLGFVDRSLQFIYDVELPSHIVPKPLDDEVEEFYLWTIDQTVEAIKQGKFKSNAAATLIDFLFRHGFISPKLEPELETVIFSLIRRRPL
ncbi:NUDIX hydrolase domain-like protein [Apiosordaria backusii]|uniref:NUDIX hydrolase domain-like protein n=1 Tax=Apiosordaria backusii TaxID=314023 RepID=A0AA40ECM9_9PEZI|nr:NUDIX hydrolase domain-like protein [Apiosordaria backusii]